jgi:EAL domain-containing protein (putative c-di-GMP-specific phosphodiesterase class I)
MELLTCTNAAIAHAKEMGQNRYSVYHKDDNYLKQAQSSILEKRRIITAIEEDRIKPWFQPIMNLYTGEIHHYEALARIHALDGTVIQPGEFITTAERYGLISRIDRIITEKTMNIQSGLKRAGKNITFSMNLSGKLLGDEDMLCYLKNSIIQSGADPDYLVFEITETATINNMSKAIAFVKALKNIGCKISLDDFGVGFTSFVHLVELEVDFLKIDGSFIRHLPESDRNRVLVKTIVDMAKGIGIKTVAEFVDREETLHILRQTGVDYAQGYLIGKPSQMLIS